MGLETAEFIDGLTESWPLGSDRRREGDDHLRLIKRVLKNTFPNLDAAVTATPEQLNAVPDALADVIAEIILHLEPAGVIKLWSGSIGSIPAGYALCDGNNGTPNLTDQFIIGAGNTFAAGTSGGSVATGSAGSHTHTIQGTALTTSQIPAHAHQQKNYPTTVGSVTRAGSVWTASTTQDGTSLTETEGGGQPHTHTADADGSHTHTVLPPYYALAYIMKLTSYVAP